MDEESIGAVGEVQATSGPDWSAVGEVGGAGEAEPAREQPVVEDGVALSEEAGEASEGDGGLASSMREWTRAESPAGGADEAAAGEQGQPARASFEYQSRETPDLRAAQHWTPERRSLSGTDANQTINQTYDRLDRDFSRWMGDPPVANWMSFGKYASREAGEQIRNLENVQKAATGDPVAAVKAASSFADLQQIQQAALLGGRTAAENAGEQGALKTALAPALAASDTLAGTTGDMVGMMGKMRNALVEGNTEIFRNIAPAYDAFLKGESSGQGGMKALAAAGYAPGSEKDPQGFVTRAFEKYGAAREIGAKAEQAKDPGEREQLLAERSRLMNEGNLQIGLQEQMVILQRPSIFGDPQMQKALGAIGGTMTLTDANGRHSLRPDGANWSSFQDRMGLRAVAPGTEGALAVRDHQGRASHYVVDPSQKGTIAGYFAQNVDGERARALIQGSPRSLDVAPATETGKGALYCAEGLRDGCEERVAGGLVRMGGGAAHDGMKVVGDGAEASSRALARDAVNRFQGAGTDFQRGVAVIELRTAQGLQAVDRTLDRARVGAKVATGAVAGLAEREVGNFKRGVWVINAAAQREAANFMRGLQVIGSWVL